MTERVLYVRVPTKNVTAFDDHCVVCLGKGDEILELVMWAIAHPDKACVVDGPVQGIVELEGDAE